MLTITVWSPPHPPHASQHELKVAKKDCEEMVKAMQDWERKVSTYAAKEQAWERDTHVSRPHLSLSMIMAYER